MEIAPDLVEATAKLLAERADYYYFISSIAVYNDFSRPGLTEKSPVQSHESGYAGQKVRAEELVTHVFEDRAGVARMALSTCTGRDVDSEADPGCQPHEQLMR